ncbi:STAS domain-containing protein [Ramlibacter sp. G-1-2-2]|uniref:STAS domain-containing protein n=2 Tax=Ramlibacter agri TaxID=2728837 RepID=A0A848H5B6_9BURK|nr:STAS domain-containing protein [Ramlibacter agri]NML44430.1 STAS domain-containing protein [Ramlibacter agri]
MTSHTDTLVRLLGEQDSQLLDDWLQEAGGLSPRISEGARNGMRAEAREIASSTRAALSAGGNLDDISGPAWAALRQALESLSRSRAAQGQSAGDTSLFVLSFKRPLFARVQASVPADAQLAAAWSISSMVDRMAQWTVTTYQGTREELIQRQQYELLELSTPVIKLFEGVLAVPMIGTLDSNRTQVVMETLLQRIVETGSRLAIIDITGVPTVDTLVAQHLLKTVSAIRLMGAECIISGIRPQIAQTIVHLGIDLQGVATKSSLADALALAMQQQGFVVTRTRGS